MKRLIFLLFIFPGILSAQGKGHIEGPIYLNKNVTVQLNQDVVEYLTANLEYIESIDGATVINIPIEREFKKARKSMIVDGYFCQYEWTLYPGGWDVTLFKIKTTYLEFDFEKDDITQKHKDDDDGMFDKPVDLKNKVKAKDKSKAGLKIKRK